MPVRMCSGAADRRQSPAGARPVTVRARPDLPTSRATQPPLLFPAMCAVVSPSSSSSSPTATARSRGAFPAPSG